MDSIRPTDWLTIGAILLAPLVAIQVERILEGLKERRRRKLTVFHTLMATRGARLSPQHVEALNRIDIEFYGTRFWLIGKHTSRVDREVLEAWHVYLDHLSTPHPDQGRWADHGMELFTALMNKMAVALHYHFDPIVLKKGGYYPQGHGDIELDQQAIRKAARAILEGGQPLKVAVAPTEYLPALSDRPGSIQV